MRSSSFATGVAAMIVVEVSPVSGQISPTEWTGSMQSGTSITPVHYRIPAMPDGQNFQIITSEHRVVTAASVQFVGVSLRFHADFGTGADCKLDAVPARGYKGACALAGGDTVQLTLVPPIAGMLLPDHEIALARNAGPPRIAAEATVIILSPSGYTAVVRGTNDFTCFIERPSANDAWPMCLNREAADNLLPVERFRAERRIAGVGDAALTDSVLAGYRTGRFRLPPPSAMAYMLSRYAWTADPETGTQSFIGPHLHIYAPFATNQRIGVDTALRPVVPMRVEREGRPDASIIVGVKLIDPK